MIAEHGKKPVPNNRKGGDNLVVTKENTDKRKPAGVVINRT